ASFTPRQVARGYAVMANGGFLVDPYFIAKIENEQGGVIFQAQTKIACPQCNLPVIYVDTKKSVAMNEESVENVATSNQQ
ncbi:penicillin-binding transpeptidase domain-containing protein, partial [Pantoea dispersa]|uniref:penicillin-binding transpeptidase domain-containing protein n=1 Tax=Pantoea dispersa TaxID=59814 RepID=UPI0021AEB4E7